MSTVRRVEMLVPAMPAAGMESMVAGLSRALVVHGLEVGITCLESEGELAAGLRADGIRVEVIPSPGLRPNIIPGKLRDWLADVKPDVAHVHSGVWLKGARAARAAGVPRVVHTAHGLLDHTPRRHLWLMWLAARLTDHIVGVSDDLSRFLTDEVGAPRSRVTTVLNGVDTDAFHPGPATGAVRRPLGLPTDVPVVGIVARLAPVKNHACLVDAFAIVHAQRPDAVLALVGKGPLHDELAAQVGRLGLTQVVRFAGAASDMPPIYRDLDIFVLSSVAEGTSISILEAMASGRCIVATAVGGSPALLDDGRAGVLVPSSDPAALAGALLELLDDPARRRALGAAARRRAEEVFSERAMVDRYLELYGIGAAERQRMAETSTCAE